MASRPSKSARDHAISTSATAAVRSSGTPAGRPGPSQPAGWRALWPSQALPYVVDTAEPVDESQDTDPTVRAVQHEPPSRSELRTSPAGMTGPGPLRPRQRASTRPPRRGKAKPSSVTCGFVLPIAITGPSLRMNRTIVVDLVHLV